MTRTVRLGLYGAALFCTAAFPFIAAAAKPITIAVPREPSSLDETATVDMPGDLPIMANVEQPLVTNDREGRPTPVLATWEVSPDGLVYTFHLRHGVRFQNGDKLTAADVLFSYRRAAAKNPVFARTLRLIDKVAALDPMTVRFTFRKFDANFFPPIFLFIESKAYFDRVGEKEFQAHPIGTGPYRVVDYKAGQYIDLAAFDGYWGAKPQVQAVRFVFVSDPSTRVAELRAGEADMIAEAPYPEITSLAKDGFATASMPFYPTTAILFQLINPNTPWARLKVRLAIAHAVDAEAIIKGLFHGLVQRTATIAPGELGYDPAMKPYSYDPALARKLLAEAGYPNGFKMPLVYATDAYGSRETTEAVLLYLKAVGIDAEAQSVEVPQILGTIRRIHDDPAARWVAVNAMPVANTGSSLGTLTIALTSRSPFAIYKNAALDAAIDAASGEPDIAKRAVDIKKAWWIVHDELPLIPLWNAVHIFVMKRGIGFTPTPRDFGIYVSDIAVH